MRSRSRAYSDKFDGDALLVLRVVSLEREISKAKDPAICRLAKGLSVDEFVAWRSRWFQNSRYS